MQDVLYIDAKTDTDLGIYNTITTHVTQLAKSFIKFNSIIYLFSGMKYTKNTKETKSTLAISLLYKIYGYSLAWVVGCQKYIQKIGKIDDPMTTTGITKCFFQDPHGICYLFGRQCAQWLELLENMLIEIKRKLF